jgi:hypothetical protein
VVHHAQPSEENVMSSQRPAHLSYLLRLWQTPGGANEPWRVSLENPLTGERRGFADLEAALMFLRAQIVAASPPDEEPGRDEANTGALQEVTYETQ